MPQFMKNPNKCSGSSCVGCSSANCMAKGGSVASVEDYNHVKGVHKQFGMSDSAGHRGESYVGQEVRGDQGIPGDLDLAKGKHKRVLAEMKSMKKPNLYAKGGEVKGVHKPSMGGVSEAGEELREHSRDEEEKMASMESVKGQHAHVLREMKSLPKPKLYSDGGEVSGKRLGNQIGYPGTEKDPQAQSKVKEQPYGYPEGYKGIDAEFAKGGEVESGDNEMDEELHHAIGGELMDALERKDKKGIMSALHAAVMSCMSEE